MKFSRAFLINVGMVFAAVFGIGFLVLSKQAPVSSVVAAETDLVQFTSGGKILGFTDIGIYVAGLDHVLNIDFVQPLPTKPVADAGTGTVQSLQKVLYRDVWQDIDVTYTAAGEGIAESTYFIHDTTKENPAEAIRLRYNRPVHLDAEGNLVTVFETGAMTESAPKAWQVIDGQEQAVPVSFVVHGEQEVGFTLGEFVSGVPLVIDPTITWNTFLGGAGDDYTLDSIALDASNNVYIAGYSNATWGSPLAAYTADNDVFVAKLNSAGALQWHTFLGGAGNDRGNVLDLDGSNNIFVSGTSSATWGSPVAAYTSNNDGFVVKLNSAGAIQWNTFLGGTGSDSGDTMAVSSNDGALYVGGTSNDTWGSPVVAYTGNSETYVAKLDNTGALDWVTFMGHAAGYDFAGPLGLDGSDNVYITGTSADTWGSPIRAFGAGSDGFVAKLNSSGVRQWHTFLGSAVGFDEGIGLSVDTNGISYTTGRSGATWGSPIRAYTAGNDAWVAKLNAAGALQWNTFLGGASDDYGLMTNIDADGTVYVAGYSEATWGSPIQAYVAGQDVLVAALDSTGVLLWNTFFGGSGVDWGRALAFDENNNLHIGGYSTVTWGSPIRSYAAGYDAFIAQLDYATPPTVSALSPADNATTVSRTTDLVLTFTQAVDAETGNITIKKTSDDSTVETIDVTGGQVTGSGSTTITVNPSVTLNPSTQYYVLVAATAFDGATSNSYAGIASTTAWSFTTQSSGSSAGTTAPPSAPPPTKDNPTGETRAVLAGGSVVTISREASLDIDAGTNVRFMSVSENPMFLFADMVPFAAHSTVTLSPDVGNKTIYVRLFASSGQSVTVSDSITLVSPEAEINEEITKPPVLPPRERVFLKREELAKILPIATPVDGLVKLANDSAVYYIGLDGKRHPFASGRAFETWGLDFAQVKVVSGADLASVPLGQPVMERPGSRWVKIQSDPKTYFVDPDGYTLRWIQDEEAAKTLGGEDWNKNIVDVEPTYFTKYQFGDPISSESLKTSWPKGSLVKTSGDSLVWFITATGRRLVVGEAFAANQFKTEFIETTMNPTWLSLPAETPITAREDALTSEQIL